MYDEHQMGNGKCGTANVEQQMWQINLMADGKWQVGNGKCGTAKVSNGKYFHSKRVKRQMCRQQMCSSKCTQRQIIQRHM